jgi:hypothetical protein
MEPTANDERKLREAGPKGFDNAAHTITELNERFKERLTLDNPRFVDRYIEAEGGFHLLVRFRIGGISEEYIAHLQREGGAEAMQSVAGNEGDIGWDGIDTRDIVNQLSRLRIIVTLAVLFGFPTIACVRWHEFSMDHLYLSILP